MGVLVGKTVCCAARLNAAFTTPPSVYCRPHLSLWGAFPFLLLFLAGLKPGCQERSVHCRGWLDLQLKDCHTYMRPYPLHCARLSHRGIVFPSKKRGSRGVYSDSVLVVVGCCT